MWSTPVSVGMPILVQQVARGMNDACITITHLEQYWMHETGLPARLVSPTRYRLPHLLSMPVL
jgi:hypothetical protein